MSSERHASHTSRRDSRRARKRAQRTVGAQLNDDEYVLSGSVAVDRRGQQWIAMRMMTTTQRQSMWWREVDAQNEQRPTTEHLESALDGKRIDALIELCGPILIESIPPRFLGLF